MSGAKKLGWYLSAISSGKVVNRQSVMKAWQAAGLLVSDMDETFDFSGGARTPARIVNVEAFGRLVAHYGEAVDMTSKSTAAISGNSHRFASRHSISLVCSFTNPHPVAVVSSTGGVSAPRNIGPVGIIVENIELFVRFKETLQFCVENAGLDESLLNTIEVIYGAGSAVISSPSAAFLRGFSCLYCLPDMDAGGLEICVKLQGKIPEIGIEVLYPDTLSQMLERAGEPLSDTERTRILLLSNNKLVSGPAKILLKTEKKLEQEVYLV